MSNRHPRGAQTRHPSQCGSMSAKRTEVPGDLRLRAERAEARVAELEAELAGMRTGIAFHTAMRAVAPVASAVLDGAA